MKITTFKSLYDYASRAYLAGERLVLVDGPRTVRMEPDYKSILPTVSLTELDAKSQVVRQETITEKSFEISGFEEFSVPRSFFKILQVSEAEYG